MSMAYSTSNCRLPACSFRGGVSPFRSYRVQHRRLAGARVSHVQAKRRDDKQGASPAGLAGKVKAGISSTASDGAGTKKLRGTDKKQAGKSEGGLKLGTFALGGTGVRRTDPNTVFVAGATGRLGCRVVLELLRNKKLKVRAAARDPDEARQLVRTATEYGILPADAARRITIVPVNLEDIESIAPAIGNAGKVVQAIGAAETKLFDFKAPARVDGGAAIKLVQVAKELNVQQYVMVTSLGTGKFGWPAGLLNLFWGVLVFKKKAEAALEKSGIPYVIVRPGGMERPTDAYKRTHNVRLATRDKLFGGQVSRLQVAELIAAAVSYPSAAQNKVLEVVAEEEAEGLPYLDLLTSHPSETDSPDASSPAPKDEAPAKAAKQQVARAAKQAQQAAPVQTSASSQTRSKPKQAPWQGLFGGKSKGTDAAGPSSSSAPSLQEASDTAQSGLADAADAINTPYFESLENSEGRRSKIDDALEAAKAERKANAQKNAERLEEQKAEQAVQAKRQAEEDKRQQEQQAKKDAENKAKKEAEAKKAAAKKKDAPKPEAKKPEPKAEPKKQPEPKKEAKVEAKKAEPKAEPKKQPEAKKSDAANTPEAKEQAKRAAANAKEASEWITNWREGKTQDKGAGKSTAQAAAKPAQAAADGAQRSAQSTQQAGRDVGKQLFGGFKFPWQKNDADKQSQQQAPAAKAAQPAAKTDDALKQPASGSADTIELRQKQARKWINDWRGDAKSAPKAEAKAAKSDDALKQPASGSADTIELRQKQARKWINDWRARTLEKKLPQGVSAKQ